MNNEIYKHLFFFLAYFIRNLQFYLSTYLCIQYTCVLLHVFIIRMYVCIYIVMH